MTFGDPIIYTCPSCGKQMKMITYNSYSVHRSDIYSDGYSTGRPHFTPDLAKCPNCKNLFFRHNVKEKTKIKRKDAGNIKDIKDPERSDLIKAFKNGTAKTWEEELQLLEDLWRDFNDDLRYGQNELSDNELEYWNAVCSALLPLTEKKYQEMHLKKNKKKYEREDPDNCLIQIAELYRNNLNFNKCIEIINTLDSDWDWLKDQYIHECERKNPSPFELLRKSDLDLENNQRTDEYDYLHRARKYEGRGFFEKAIADYNKAEELGYKDYNLFIDRADIYAMHFKNHDKAIIDYSKALSFAQVSLKEEMGKNKPLNIDCYTNWVLHALYNRSREYELIGELENAFNDINTVIKTQNDYLIYKDYENTKKSVWEYEEIEKKKAEDAIKATDPEFFKAIDLYEERKFEKAVEIFNKLAKQEHSGAMFMLGECYSNGNGVKENDKKSAQWHLKAAEMGYPDAQYKIGNKYLCGRGVEEDKEKAILWYLKAAEQGHVDSQRGLGYFYKRGNGVEQDYSKAVYWFHKAAEQGNADSQEQLGELYTNGLGAEQDYKKAFEWYEKSAKQGLSDSILILGDLYMEGKGVEQDYAAAVKCYRKIADYGWNIALFKLGECYEYGKGIEQDLSQAIYLYRKSARVNSYEPAREKLKELGIN